MGKHEDQIQAWCALWARLQERDSDPDGGRSSMRAELSQVVAVAGLLKHYEERAANDLEAVRCALLLLWLLYWLYANTGANSPQLRANRRRWPGEAADAEPPDAARDSHDFPALPTESRSVPIPVQFLTTLTLIVSSAKSRKSHAGKLEGAA